MSDADLIGIERIDRCRNKVSQFQPRSHEDGTLAHLRRDLLDAVLRLVQVQQGAEALRLFQRVNILALQVFNDGHFDGLSIGEIDDANGHGRDFGHLRGAVTPCSGDNLETVLGERPDKQGRENALGTDGFRQFLQSGFLEGAAGVGLRLIQQSKRDVAVLGGVDDLGFHDGVLLSSG